MVFCRNNNCIISNILDSLNLKICFDMRKNLLFFIYILHVFVIFLSKADVNKQCYQRQFRLKSFGFLASAYKVLFSGDGGSFNAALRECTGFCWGDRRCIGMEVCRIREDLCRCRACCKWMKLGANSDREVNNDMAACKYSKRLQSKLSLATLLIYISFRLGNNKCHTR